MLETLSLAKLIQHLINHQDWQGHWDKPSSDTPTDDNKERSGRHISNVEEICENLQFDIEDCVERIRGKLSGKESYERPMAFYWMELYNRILNEAKKHRFAHIPSDKVRYFDAESLFGYDVEYQFPSASIEIESAAKCYAFGEYTASVFHSMRCVEIGARSLIFALDARKHLKRPIQLCDWGDLVGAIQEGLKVLRVGSRTTLAKKEKYEFYNDAAARFMNFKDAWRNNVAHTRTIYIEGQARDIFENTRQFMQHLAERVKERNR